MGEKKCTPREKILGTRMRIGPRLTLVWGPRMVNPELRKVKYIGQLLVRPTAFWPPNQILWVFPSTAGPHDINWSSRTHLQFLFLLGHDVLADGGHGQHEADQEDHREVVVDEMDVLVVAVRRVGEHLQTGSHRLVDLQPVTHHHWVVLRERIAQYVDDCRVDGVLQLHESLLVITCTTPTQFRGGYELVSSRILRPTGIGGFNQRQGEAMPPQIFLTL